MMNGRVNLKTESNLIPERGGRTGLVISGALLLATICLSAQPNAPQDGPPRGFGPGPGGPGGPPMGVQADRKLVTQFDQNGNGRLELAERKVARTFLAAEKAEGRAPRRPGPPGRRNDNSPPPEPGPKFSQAEAKSFPGAPLYDLKTLRTLFLEFESPDWEKELADFVHTDVEVPVKLTVDGKSYTNVGVHFRGASSFFMVGEGRKRSLNLSMDFVHPDQRLEGYRTLDLLNSHGDPTLLRAVLYSQIAGGYLPTPKANYVRVVINGESWGVYVNVQQFNKDFTKEAYGSTKGARWKVPGSPRASAALKYTGDDVAEYKKHYEIKTKDDPKAWAELIKLCRVLSETPTSELEKKLSPLLDLEGTLKFLALESVFINNDGYWVRGSDFNLSLDAQGQFHLVPHDVNETFSLPGGPGFRGGPGARGVELDPLTGADDASKPLLNKLLAVPALKARYLGYVKEIATRWLDWKKIGPLAEQYQALITTEVKQDTRKLESYEDFISAVKDDGEQREGPGPGRRISLKNFVEQRRTYLVK